MTTYPLEHVELTARTKRDKCTTSCACVDSVSIDAILEQHLDDVGVALADDEVEQRAVRLVYGVCSTSLGLSVVEHLLELLDRIVLDNKSRGHRCSYKARPDSIVHKQLLHPR
ncbi:uncharacterized protein LOC100278809 [Zea mays]|jgi:hypothetical protein|uniref:Uncharacterized protein n=1 Tax=Zea mays TaxID=4577 RepID=B6TXM4_MAIZE|nr:uncharacterized protein LOC100278809 [Zea mays]ACG41857.1 hypothetical protein [Zea mays]ACG47560.1 hypothetical protein [Zea mays]|eukprot:NP_001145436.1 uncharacterized protein LOC100278809 [Zea mays]